MLFMIHSNGGFLELSRLVLLLYLSDLKHLSRYGSLITGDTYVAMKNGPIPFHILSIYKQLKGDDVEKNEFRVARTYLAINDKQQAIALLPYDKDQLSSSEVECLFEVLHQYKNYTPEQLSASTMDKAWKEADINGEISLEYMIIESGASREMSDYINISYTDEMTSFNA